MNLRRFFLFLTLSAALLLLSGCGETVTYDQSDYAPGTTEDFTYTGSQLGLSVTLNDQWLIYGPENYESVIGLKQDLNHRAQIEDILNAGQSVYEFYAADADRTILRVAVEDLRVRYDDDINAQDYAESQATHLAKMADVYALENVEVQLGTTEVAGQSYPSIYLTSEMVHVPHYELYVYLHRGNYMYTITCSCIEVDRTAELLALFEPAS